MKTVESALEELYELIWTCYGPTGAHIIKNQSDMKFIEDIVQKTKTNNRISTKQAYIVLKLLKTYVHVFEKYSKITTRAEVIELCNNPCYRLAPYQSIEVPREVRYLGRRILGFKMKFSAQLIERIRAFKDPFNVVGKHLPSFNSTHKIWLVEVTEHNFSKIMKFIPKAYFEFDDAVVDFLHKCSESTSVPSNIKVSEDAINLTVNNNELLCAWAEQILELEENLNVHTD
jgi:hypothetical protein